jgi:hypothetical protein
MRELTDQAKNTSAPKFDKTGWINIRSEATHTATQQRKKVLSCVSLKRFKNEGSHRRALWKVDETAMMETNGSQ